MPDLPTPQEFKELIPTPGGSFCERFLNALNLPRLVSRVYSYFVGDDLKLTTEGAAFICGLDCEGLCAGGGAGDLDRPVVSASDGAFIDKIRITWTTVANATEYELYRNTSSDSTTAQLITTTPAATYDDADVSVGVTYYYWVKAKNATQTSGFSAPDTGYVAVEITAVTDLAASKGYGQASTSVIALQWTAPNGAQRWDIYRGVSDNFAAAEKIASDRTAFNYSESASLGPTPIFIDNLTDLVYFDEPPTQEGTYYYWVVAKGVGGSISVESNSAAGWSIGDGVGLPDGQIQAIGSGETFTVPTTTVRAFIVLFGAGGGGAGGSLVYGGGGGGVSAVLWGHYTISGATPKFRVISTPDSDTGRAAENANAADGSVTALQFAPDGTTWASLLTANAPGGGDFSSTGGGAGGAGASGTAHGSVEDAEIKDGKAGLAAMGSKGGMSGHRFASIRTQRAFFISSRNGNGTQTSPGGGGGSGVGVIGNDLKGGSGKRGYAVIHMFRS